MKKVCMVGLGYIGLPTASLLATKGFQVHGVDINKDIVAALNAGKVLIYEPSLDVLVKSAVQSGNLSAATTPVPADVFIIAVPTPFKEGHKPDLSYVESAVRLIAPCVASGSLVILESTSPVGTTDFVCHLLRELRPELFEGQNTIFVAHCPERVLPGKILQELVENDRVVGGVDNASTNVAVAFYRSFVQGEVLSTTARTAELVKLAENSFRDVNIAFANELSLICAELGVNVWDTIRLANRHPRVNILRPGTGVGGHCIAVDPWFIVDSAPTTARLIHMARLVNDGKPQWVLTRTREKAARFTAPRVACLGIAFKPDIDDLRESPALQIVKELAETPNMELFVVEPYVSMLPTNLAHKANVSLVPLEQALQEADIVLVLVGHKSFRAMPREVLLQKIVLDVCGVLEEHA